MNIRKLIDIITFVIFTLISTAIVSSCTDENLFGDIPLSDDGITFRATVSDVWQDGSSTRTSSQGGTYGSVVKKAYKVDNSASADPLYIFEAVSESFGSSNAEEAGEATRGHVIGSNQYDDNPFDNVTLGVYSYYTGRPEMPFYMANVPYKRSHTFGNIWESAEEKYMWPLWNKDENKLQFFAYAPYNADNTGKTGFPKIRIEKNGGNVKLHYAVPDKVEDQVDLMVSRLTDIEDIENVAKSGAKLDFHHALTSVRVVCKGGSLYPGTITGLKLRNIVREGVYDITTQMWDTGNSTLHDYEYVCKAEVGEHGNDHLDNFTAKDGAYDEELLTSSKFTFMMIPQNSTKRKGPKPVLEITYEDKATGTQRKFIKELDIDWQQGKTICYNITDTPLHTEYTFNVEVKGGSLVNETTGECGEVIDGEGRGMYPKGNQELKKECQPEVKVTSFYTVYQYAGSAYVDEGNVITKGTCPAKWKTIIELKNESGQYVSEHTPDWLVTKDEIHCHNDAQREKENTVTIPIEVKEIVNREIVNKEIEELRNSATIGEKDAPHDLSIFEEPGGKKKRITANSYIVSSKGYYKIPIVYGNAIDGYTDNLDNLDNLDNKKAYIVATSNANNIMTRFLRHDGKGINNPWIINNFPEEKDKKWTAEWVRFETTDNSKTDLANSLNILGIDEEKKFLSFEVRNVTTFSDTDGLYPGNAVIAIKNSRGEVLWHWHIWITRCFEDGPPTMKIGNYDVMRYSLGQLKPNQAIYRARDMKIKFIQEKEDGGITKSFTYRFVQEGDEVQEYAQSLYYQFGRMDPVYAYYYRKAKDKCGNPCIEGQHRTFITDAYKGTAQDGKEDEYNIAPPNSVGFVIRHPGYIFHSEEDKRVYLTNYKNLWNNGTEYNPIKTVYDPCPPGYMVPPSADIWDHFAILPSWDFKEHQFQYEEMVFPRGITGICKYDEDEKRIKISHNNRYTSYWTGNFESLLHPHAVSFYFKLNSDPKNNPEYEGVKKNETTFSPSYLSAIRPIKEP